MKSTFLILIFLGLSPITSTWAQDTDTTTSENNYFRIVCQISLDHDPDAYSGTSFTPRTVILEQQYTNEHTGSELIKIFPDLRKHVRVNPFKAYFHNDKHISFRGMTDQQRNEAVETIMRDQRIQREFDQETGFGQLDGNGDFVSKTFRFHESNPRGYIIGVSANNVDGILSGSIAVQDRNIYASPRYYYDCYPPQAIAVEENSQSEQYNSTSGVNSQD